MGWSKKTASLGFAVLLLCANSAMAKDELVEVPVGRVFIPSRGYDDNDQIEVLVEGELPNPCFTIAQPKVEKEESNRIRIRQFAWVSHTGNCGSGDLIDDPVPFTTVALLGEMPSRQDYEVVFDKKSAGQKSRQFEVEVAKSTTIDNFSYAFIRSIDVEESYVEGKDVKVTVRGKLPFIGKALVTPMEIQKQRDVIVVLPKLMDVDPIECPTTELSFKETLNLGELTAGTYAVHMRSRGGHAVHAIVTVKADNRR